MLTVLNVSHNKLTCLPAAIGEYVFLTCLVYKTHLNLFWFKVSKNLQLTGLPLLHLGRLQMLKSLDVSFNVIQSIPEEIGAAAALVKYVSIGFHNIAFAKELRNWAKIFSFIHAHSRFDCSNNQLKDLPDSLGRCSNLAEIKVVSLDTCYGFESLDTWISAALCLLVSMSFQNVIGAMILITNSCCNIAQLILHNA